RAWSCRTVRRPCDRPSCFRSPTPCPSPWHRRSLHPSASPQAPSRPWQAWSPEQSLPLGQTSRQAPYRPPLPPLILERVHALFFPSVRSKIARLGAQMNRHDPRYTWQLVPKGRRSSPIPCYSLVVDLLESRRTFANIELLAYPSLCALTARSPEGSIG